MTDTTTQTLFLAFNEDGDIAADMDRDTAIERLKDEYGGHFARVIEMKVQLPAFVDLQAAMMIPTEIAEPSRCR